MMKTRYIVSLNFLVFIFITSFNFPYREEIKKADKIYFNGIIITIDSKNTIAEALAVKNGRILEVGKFDEIVKYKDKNTKMINLHNKTMLPGFIDGHSHFMSLGRLNTINIAPPPVGTVKNIADIISVLKFEQKNRNIKKGEWIYAGGYDPDQLEEKRHPTKEDLDKAFPDHPVYLNHTSSHMAVVNSYALKLSKVDANTKNPAGGKIVKGKDGEPTGLLLEAGKFVIKRKVKILTLAERLKLLDEQQELYASEGITTAQDGSSTMSSINLLKTVAKNNKLYIDIEVLPSFTVLKKIVEEKLYAFDTLENGLKLKGTKMFADGSPQGLTAFFTKPYIVNVDGCESNCRGISTTNQKAMNARILFCFENNIQPYIHCNGDAAIDMYIKAVKNANSVYPNRSKKLKPVIIHSQFVRPDQLDEYKSLGMIPSFFTNHAFFWGDVHLRNLGKERAWFLSPLKTTLNKKIVFTNHTDFGVTPINQLFLLWTSVARESRTGQIIGPAERVSVLEGLRAITINGAIQYGEETDKGSIEKGKKADLIILSDNPLKVEISKIKDLKVLETIKSGKTIYLRK